MLAIRPRLSGVHIPSLNHANHQASRFIKQPLRDKADNAAFPLLDKIVEVDLSRRFTPEQAKAAKSALQSFARETGIKPVEDEDFGPRTVEQDRNIYRFNKSEFIDQTDKLQILASGLRRGFFRKDYAEPMTRLLGDDAPYYFAASREVQDSWKMIAPSSLVMAWNLVTTQSPDLTPVQNLDSKLQAIGRQAPSIKTMQLR